MSTLPSRHSDRSLLIAKPKVDIEKGGSDFNLWLQRKYLPENFEWNDQEASLEIAIETRKRCYRKIKFDLKELLHGFSILILVIWISSLVIFGFYAEDDCSLLHSKQPELSTNLTTPGTPSENQTHAPNATMAIATEGVSLSTQSYRLHRIMQRLKHLEASYNGSHHISDCTIASTFALSNFTLSTIMALYLFMYLFHVVEMAPEFPWYFIEIAWATVYMLLIFALAVALCITSHLDLFVILAILQFICAAFFILSRYDQYKSGLSPQNDVANENDYFRSVKNIFKSIEGGSREEFSKKLTTFKGKQINEDSRKSTHANEVSKRQAKAVKSALSPRTKLLKGGQKKNRVANKSKSTLRWR